MTQKNIVLEKELCHYRQDLSRKEAELEEQLSKLNSISKENLNFQSKIRDSERQCSVFSEKIIFLTARSESLQTIQDDLVEAIQDKTNALNSKITKCKELQDLLVAANKSTKDLKTCIQDEKSDSSAAKAKNKKLSEENSGLKERLEVLLAEKVNHKIIFFIN